MKYPIAMEQGSDTQAWGVVVPDLPGCFSAADEGIDEASRPALLAKVVAAILPI